MSGADERIFALLACEHGIKRERITGRSRLQGDLGMDGDDAVAFFAAIERGSSADARSAAAMRNLLTPHPCRARIDLSDP